MEIQCPNCLKKLSIGDQFAGQLVKCPACSGVFMAPTLATTPPVASPVLAVPAVAPTVAMPTPDVIPFSSEPPPRPQGLFTPPPAPPPPPPPPKIPLEEETSGPPGELTGSYMIRLVPDVVRWVAPVALAVLFVLSFFPWIAGVALLIPLTPVHFNLWQIAFGDSGSALWIIYLLLTLFLALPLAWVKFLMESNVVPVPDFLRPFWFWRSVALGGVTALGLTCAVLGWLRLSAAEPTAIGMFLGLRVHLIALVACGLEFWLAHRKKKKLPFPEMTVRW